MQTDPAVEDAASEVWAQHCQVMHLAKQPKPDGWGLTRTKAILAASGLLRLNDRVEQTVERFLHAWENTTAPGVATDLARADERLAAALVALRAVVVTEKGRKIEAMPVREKRA